MYIRTSTRRNKNGTRTRYVYLAHNVWDPRRKRSAPQLVYPFGREDEVDKEALRRLARSIRRFLGPEEELQAQADGHRGNLRYLGSRPLGGAWVLHQLWEQLGIRRALERLLTARRYRTPVERALFALVANRALAPSSKLQVEEWVAEGVAIPELPEVPVQQLYRAMDFLLAHQEEVQWQVYTAVADLLNLEVDLLYFDTTSTYFEVEEEDEDRVQEGGTVQPGLRRRGYSKDHRPDLPQAIIGLAVTREGLPVRCWVWPGNTADMAVVPEVKRDLTGWRLGRVITVVDRGFVSEANLRELQRGGGHYIAGERLRSGKAGAEAALARAGRYRQVADGVKAKEIFVGQGEDRERYVMVWSEQRAKRDQAQRERLVTRLREEVQRLGHLRGAEHTRAVCALRAHPTYGRYLTTDRHGRLRLNRATLAEEARLEGKYLLRTSDDTLSVGDVALGYKQLYEVEDAFRCLKRDLDLRPMYHRMEDRIRAHVLLCWLALLLIRLAEHRTGWTWPTLARSLQSLHLGEFGGHAGRIWQRSEPRPEHERLFQALGVPPPPQFSDVQVRPLGS